MLPSKYLNTFQLKNNLKVSIYDNHENIVNDKEETRILLRLVVKVGSLYENEKISGISHFVEHLAFKSTKNFPNNTIINEIQTSTDSQYGPDLNAKTSQTSTIYELDLKDKYLFEGLKILNEWAFNLSFLQNDIDTERKIIEEEYIMKQNRANRVRNKFWDEAFPIHAKLMPIGSLDFIRSVNSETLKEFYHQHYTPENMQIIICGKITPNYEMNHIISHLNCMLDENIVTKPLSKLTTTNSILLPTIPKSMKPKLIAIYDKEISQSSISIDLFIPSILNTDSLSHHDIMINEMLKMNFVSAMDHRMKQLIKHNAVETPIISFSCNQRLFFHQPKIIECLTFNFTYNLNTSLDSLNIILNELFYIAENGFSQGEIQLSKTKWINRFQQQLTLKNQTITTLKVQELIENCLLNEKTPLSSVKEESLLAIDVLNKIINSTSVNKYVDEILKFDGSYYSTITIQEPENKNHNINIEECFADQLGRKSLIEIDTNANYSHKHIAALLNNHSEIEIKDNLSFDEFPLLISSSVNTNNPLQLFKLENGMEVFIKNTDVPNPKISFQAFALGGISSAKDPVIDAAMTILPDILHESKNSLGIDFQTIQRIEAEEGNSVFIQRHLFHRGVGGSGRNFILLLRMIVGLLSMPKQKCNLADVEVFERIKRISLKRLESVDNSNAMLMGRKIKEIMLNVTEDSEPVLKELTHETMSKVRILFLFVKSKTNESLHIKVTFEMIEQLYRDSFLANPLNFKFVFIGNFDIICKNKISLENMLNNTLGKLKKHRINEKLLVKFDVRNQLNIKFPLKPVVHEFQGNESSNNNKNSVMIGYKVNFISKNTYLDFQVKIFCKLVKLLLLNALRSQKNLIYSINCELSRNTLAEFGIIFISFTCNDDKTYDILKIIDEELIKLKTTNIYEQYTDLVVKQQEKYFKVASENSSYLLFFILDGFQLHSINYKQPSREKLLNFVSKYLDFYQTEEIFMNKVKDTLNNTNSLANQLLSEQKVSLILTSKLSANKL